MNYSLNFVIGNEFYCFLSYLNIRNRICYYCTLNREIGRNMLIIYEKKVSNVIKMCY